MREPPEPVAKVSGAPVSDEIRRAISEHIDARRADKEFQARLRGSIERHREVIEKLAR